MWGEGTNTPPTGLDVCIHQALPPPETGGCCVDRLVVSFDPAQSVWVINHNKGRIPASVEVMSAIGRVTTARIDHTTTNQTVITHSLPLTGYVILLL